MKVKDLPKDTQLVGVKVRIPKQFQAMYSGPKGPMVIFSSWNQGIWLKKSMIDSKIYPLCMDPKNLLDFTVVK
jgi:hypothetical protein